MIVIDELFEMVKSFNRPVRPEDLIEKTGLTPRMITSRLKRLVEDNMLMECYHVNDFRTNYYYPAHLPRPLEYIRKIKVEYGIQRKSIYG